MDAAELRRLRKENPARAVLESRGWYHSFRFPDGTEFPGVLPVEISEYRYSKFPLPADLTGKRLLDIGAWDGWFSFEAERRGAQVTALDTVEVPNFWKVHRKLGSQVEYREVDLFEIPGAGLGKFDYVFFLGVLYHTKHPVLALEIVCALTLDIAVVESYVIDSATWEKHLDDLPAMEFYETDELAGQLDNWCGPTVGCLMAMCRTAGFARVEVLHVENNRAALACYRRDEPVAAAVGEPLRLVNVTNTIRGGINFRATRDEYLSWWFEYDGDALSRADLRFEAGGFGVPVTHVSRSHGHLWLATSRLPPGLDPGWHHVRLRLHGGPWSTPLRIAVDLEPRAGRVELRMVCDSHTWREQEIDLSHSPAYISAWVAGLSENADDANCALLLEGRKLRVTFVGHPDSRGLRQVNAEWPEEAGPGTYSLTARFAGIESNAVEVRAASAS